jgi:hypothetical protein
MLSIEINGAQKKKMINGIIFAKNKVVLNLNI